MAITTAMPTSFKVELLTGTHNFTNTTGHTFKLALIKATPAGTYGAASTNYSNITGNSDEASGTGYTAGGATLTSVTPTSNSTSGVCDFSDVTFSTATVSADGCMIYNTSASNAACSVHDFGGTKTSTAADFVLTMPAATAGNAVIELA